MLQIKDESGDGVRICHLQGRLDGSTSATADQHLTQLANEAAAGKIVLDLAGLDYMSSAGLRVLLMAAKRAKSNGSRLSLAAPQPAVGQVLEISGFASILEIHPTLNQAIGATAP